MYFIESDEEVILRFMKGLHREIKERIPSQSLINCGYWEVVKIALRVELQIRRERSQTMKKIIPLQPQHQSKDHQDTNIVHASPTKEEIIPTKVEDVPNASNEKVHSIIDLKFSSNNICENVHDSQFEDKPSVVQAEMINMVLPIAIEDKKVILEEDMVEKIKLVGECIEQTLEEDKCYSLVVHSWKSSSFQGVTHKRKKKMKYGFFKVAKKIYDENRQFELKDDLLLHIKFHPPNKLKIRGRIFF